MPQPGSHADDVTRHQDLLCAILTAGMLAAGHSVLEPNDVMRLYRRNRREMFPKTTPPQVE